MTGSKATSADEVQINEKLQLFVRNYKIVYEWTPRRSEVEKGLHTITMVHLKSFIVQSMLMREK